MLLILIIIIGATVLFYLYQSRNLNFWKNKNVPTASKCHWFFGHYKPFLFGQKHLGFLLQDIYDEYPEAPYVGYLNFSSPCLNIKDPEIVRAILTTDFNAFSENLMKVDKKTDVLMGYNPFVLHGTEWKTVRSHASPIITFSKLKSYFPTMRHICDEMVHYVKNKCDERGLAELETKKFSGMYTTDIITNVILGVTNNTFKDEKSLFAQLTSEILANNALENFKVFLTFTIPNLAPFIGMRFSPKRLEAPLISLAKRRMKETSNLGKNDLFEQMKSLKAHDKSVVINEKYLASLCFTFLLDGYETSSELMCYTLFELAWHSDVQNRLRDEIMQFIAETNDQYNVGDVEKLKYLDMVISESLRLHPLLTELSKICTSDYKIPGHPLTITKGTTVNIPVLGLHLDEKYFPKPNKFDPERFTDEAIADRHKFVYLPFGEGPRKCLGQRLALLQIKLSILYVVKNFRLKPSANSNYPLDVDSAAFISRPLNGAWIHFQNIAQSH